MIVPDWVGLVSRTGVALNRIESFLEEEEVPDCVSSLKRAPSSPIPSPEDKVLGIRNGSFQWNKPKQRANPIDDVVSSEAEEESRFELRDISVMFPVGRLSVVTGAGLFEVAFGLPSYRFLSRSHRVRQIGAPFGAPG